MFSKVVNFFTTYHVERRIVFRWHQRFNPLDFFLPVAKAKTLERAQVIAEQRPFLKGKEIRINKKFSVRVYTCFFGAAILTGAYLYPQNHFMKVTAFLIAALAIKILTSPVTSIATNSLAAVIIFSYNIKQFADELNSSAGINMLKLLLVAPLLLAVEFVLYLAACASNFVGPSYSLDVHSEIIEVAGGFSKRQEP